jgi:hypothetical protein
MSFHEATTESLSVELLKQLLIILSGLFANFTISLRALFIECLAALTLPLISNKSRQRIKSHCFVAILALGLLEQLKLKTSFTLPLSGVTWLDNYAYSDTFMVNHQIIRLFLDVNKA